MASEIFDQVLEHIDAVIEQEPPLGSALWEAFAQALLLSNEFAYVD